MTAVTFPISRRRIVSPLAAVAALGLLFFGIAGTSASAAPASFGTITLPAGADSEQVTFGADGQYAYVTLTELDQVAVIRVATNEVTTFAVGDMPIGIATSPDGSELWVGHWNDHNVRVYDTATNAQIGSPIATGGIPSNIVFAPDGSKAYISDYDNSSVIVADAATKAMTGAIEVSTGEPQGLAISPDGSELWITSHSGGHVDVADTSTNLVVDSVVLADPPGPGASWPFDLAITPDGSTVYATESGDASGLIVAIDTETRAINPAKSIVTGSTAAAVAVSPDGVSVYAAYGSYGTSQTPEKNGLIPVNSATGVHGATFLTGAGTRDVAVSPDGLVYVLNSGSGTITVVGEPVTRINGSDRYDVGVRIATAMYPQLQPPTGRTVFVATGENYPDALSAGPVAAQFNAPLLLTPGASLPTSVADELVRLGADQVYIVGGPNSVSTAVENSLKSIVGAANVQRLSGADRFEASRTVVSTGFPGHADTVYLSTGFNYPDALSASAAGAGGPNRAPVLLVNGGPAALDAATLDAIAHLTPGSIRIAGGPNSVSMGIQNQLEQLYPGAVSRLGGSDRFAASFSINDAAFPTSGPDPVTSQRVFVATGYKFPDALAGAPWAGQLNAPLFVVPGTCVPQNMLDKFTALGVKQVTLIGGPASLDQAVFDLTPCA